MGTRRLWLSSNTTVVSAAATGLAAYRTARAEGRETKLTMTTIAFIGLGNMGAGMAANLAKAGHDVVAFDLSATALERARASGCRAAATAAEAVAGGDVIITMLPAGA